MVKDVSVESVAEAYLELLAARGIEYLFGNGGTDFAPIIEAYAKRLTQEQVLPRPIPVPHEVTAVSMAYGYTMVTGRPQAVMVHTTPGTANAVSGIISASRANIPMLFTAGRTPITCFPQLGERQSAINREPDQSEGFARTGYLVPARGLGGGWEIHVSSAAVAVAAPGLDPPKGGFSGQRFFFTIGS